MFTPPTSASLSPLINFEPRNNVNVEDTTNVIDKDTKIIILASPLPKLSKAN